MNRGYEDQLIAARTQLLVDEAENYPEEVRLFAASLIEMGESVVHISELLNIEPAIIMAWHTTYITHVDFAIREDEFSFFRDKNVLRADARTIGSIVKSCLENEVSPEDAAIAVGVNIQTVNAWIVKFGRDYPQMINLLPGCEVKVKSIYVLGLEAKEELQGIIYHHDNQEAILAAERRMEYMQGRNT